MKRHHSRKMHKKRSAKTHRRHRGGSYNRNDGVLTRTGLAAMTRQADSLGLSTRGGKAGRRHKGGDGSPSMSTERAFNTAPKSAIQVRDLAANQGDVVAMNSWLLKTASRPRQIPELNTTSGGKALRRHKKGGSPRSMRRMPSYKVPVRAVEDMGQGMEQGALAAGKGFAETAGDAVEGVVRATQATYIRNRDKLRRDSRSIVDRVKGFGNAITRRLSGLVGGKRTHKKHRK